MIKSSQKGMSDKIVQWKPGLEVRGLKMNAGKTKIMFSCSMKDRVDQKSKWLRGNDSILSCSCKKWIHKQCNCSLHNT